ncbi:transcriptional regulator FtsR [Trueperella pyogenes]|uniref:MerR family transcriptional regulator n=1 Tax=Trueperella pyogenes TaxID=1661 RepID=A0A380MBH5_9ACTO|nr:MerR family transcriptional regulator [Trueperella pyogenes]AJC69611.1 MerR family transcriptional regulator [Trueperella pyogenes TP8]AWG04649.1 MerR family transcriptional regulator [Trueperella pyogenes]AWG15476.1 MerR family transcriptional regulator [Trueperella pyogenes]AZR04363.1 MerR family transcriptional regulator [Trueperella pyogenes]AZR06069.1 MerR family transcriptional regulator [Trueperella pyogenes]
MTPLLKRVGSEELPSSWPQDVSHEPTLKIGEVTSHLRQEFPFLAASKIRYFESQGLIEPYRTDSNQRIFSLADLERLRFILVEQRDRYVPLPQIKEMLAQLDSGRATQEHPGKLRALASDVDVRPTPGTRIHKDELAALTGASLAEIDQLIAAGMITLDARGRMTAHAVDIVRYGKMLADAGMDIRGLRQVKNSAHAHATNVVGQLATERARNTPVAKERVVNESAEMATMMTNLYRALLAENIDVQLR